MLSEMNNNEAGVFETSYSIKADDTYVRTVITFFDGTQMYLNPVTRHEDEKMEDQSLAHVSYLRTAVVWSLYLVSVALIMYLLLKRRKSRFGRESFACQNENSGCGIGFSLNMLRSCFSSINRLVSSSSHTPVRIYLSKVA